MSRKRLIRGALITPDEESWREIMMYATQYRESYPYYQHEKIGYNFHMSNTCAGIEARPVWKPMHCQPVYKRAPAYINGVSEAVFKVGMCLPAGPYVTDDDVKYIVETIKNAIVD